MALAAKPDQGEVRVSRGAVAFRRDTPPRANSNTMPRCTGSAVLPSMGEAEALADALDGAMHVSRLGAGRARAAASCQSLRVTNCLMRSWKRIDASSMTSSGVACASANSFSQKLLLRERGDSPECGTEDDWAPRGEHQKRITPSGRCPEPSARGTERRRGISRRELPPLSTWTPPESGRALAGPRCTRQSKSRSCSSH